MWAIYGTMMGTCTAKLMCCNDKLRLHWITFMYYPTSNIRWVIHNSPVDVEWWTILTTKCFLQSLNGYSFFGDTVEWLAERNQLFGHWIRLKKITWLSIVLCHFDNIGPSIWISSFRLLCLHAIYVLRRDVEIVGKLNKCFLMRQFDHSM